MSAGYKTGSNRKQHVGIGWLGCCLGACAPSVTLESPHDRCSSLMSLKGRIRVFCFFFVSFSHKANRAPYILHMAAFYSPGTNGTAHCSACEVKFPLHEYVNDRTQPLTLSLAQFAFFML